MIAYGSARDLALGVEAVLADGRVLSGLSKLRKDNTGYDLTRLMIGSEGTLGAITAATLKLFPRPRARVTAFVGLADPGRALELLNFCNSRTGGALQAFDCCPVSAWSSCSSTTISARDPFPHVFPCTRLSNAPRWTRTASGTRLSTC